MLVSIIVNHLYCASSPRKLTSKVDMLTQKLQEKTSILRNARKRETRLRGKAADLLHRVKNMQLLSTKAEELLQAYKHIPLHLLSGKVGQKFTDEQKQFASLLQSSCLSICQTAFQLASVS